MHILVLSNNIPSENIIGGIFAFDQAKALARYGHKVTFAVVDLRSIRRKRKLGLQHYNKEGIEVFSIAVPVGAVPPALMDAIGKWALRRLYKIIEAEAGRPDVVHAHFLNMGVIAADLCGRERLPLVITEHSSSVNVENLPETMAKRAKYAYTSAEKVLAVSSALAKKIKKHTGVEPVVLPNILNMPAMADVCERKKASGFHFISAGSLVEGKGFDTLVEAFEAVAKDRPDATLLIMGGGPEEKRLKAQVKERGLSDKIGFFGSYQRQDFARELMKADAFVLATRLETFGVVFIEALSFGVPVIATRCGGPEDFVDASNGLLVDVGDIQSLAQAMIDMAENIGRYNKTQIAVSTRSRFSPEKIAQQLTEVYKEICREAV